MIVAVVKRIKPNKKPNPDFLGNFFDRIRKMRSWGVVYQPCCRSWADSYTSVRPLCFASMALNRGLEGADGGSGLLRKKHVTFWDAIFLPGHPSRVMLSCLPGYMYGSRDVYRKYEETELGMRTKL